MIKKSFYTVIIIAITFFLFQFISSKLYKHHDIYYKMNKDGKEFVVNEVYEKKKDVDDYYYISIKYNDKVFEFDQDNLFNHQKKIVKDLEFIEKDDVSCMMIDYVEAKKIKNNQNNKRTRDNKIRCYKGNQKVSYLLVDDKIKLSDFKLSNKAQLEYYQVSNVTDDKYGTKYFYKNFFPGEHVIVYNYHNILIYTYRGISTYDFSTKDHEKYHNEHAYMIKNKYLMPLYDKEFLIDSYIVFDVINKRIDFLNFKYPTAKTSYVQGIVNDKLYFFNKTDDIQYEIDPFNAKLKEFSKGDQAKYFDGSKWKKINKNDLVVENVIFPIQKYKALNKYEYDFVTSDTRAFYFYKKEEDNYKFYKLYKKSLDNPILLYEDDDIKDAYITNGHIYYIKGDTLYKADRFGKRKLIINNEFVNNYKDIVKAYYEEHA